MIRALRIASTRRAYDKANARYVNYNRSRAGAWAHPVAKAMLADLMRLERQLCALINGARS